MEVLLNYMHHLFIYLMYTTWFSGLGLVEPGLVEPGLGLVEPGLGSTKPGLGLVEPGLGSTKPGLVV
jgi:hypothetical protein